LSGSTWQTQKKKKKTEGQNGLKQIRDCQKVTFLILNSFVSSIMLLTLLFSLRHLISCGFLLAHNEKKKKEKEKCTLFFAVVAAMLGAAAASSHSESPGAAKGPRVRSGVN
jgi:hypothetical protein